MTRSDAPGSGSAQGVPAVPGLAGTPACGSRLIASPLHGAHHHQSVLAASKQGFLLFFKICLWALFEYAGVFFFAVNVLPWLSNQSL